jgi:hypothetical protein
MISSESIGTFTEIVRGRRLLEHECILGLYQADSVASSVMYDSCNHLPIRLSTAVALSETCKPHAAECEFLVQGSWRNDHVSRAAINSLRDFLVAETSGHSVDAAPPMPSSAARGSLIMQVCVEMLTQIV